MSNEEQRHRDKPAIKQGPCLRILSSCYEPTRTTRQQPAIYHCECLRRILESSSSHSSTTRPWRRGHEIGLRGRNSGFADGCTREAERSSERQGGSGKARAESASSKQERTSTQEKMSVRLLQVACELHVHGLWVESATGNKTERGGGGGGQLRVCTFGVRDFA